MAPAPLTTIAEPSRKRKRDDDDAADEKVVVIKKENEAAIRSFKLSPDEIKVINSRCEQPQIHNVVATASLMFKPNISQLAWQIGGLHDVGGFSASLTHHNKDPRSTTLVFGTGACVNTGCRSPEAARYQLYRYVSVLRQLGYPARLSNFRIYNMHCTVYLNYTIDCQKMQSTLKEVGFSPRLFNAVKYEMRDPDVTHLIFSSGSMVITGARDYPSIITAFHKIIPILAHFKVAFMTPTEIRAEKMRMKKMERMQVDIDKRELRESQMRITIISNYMNRQSIRVTSKSDVLAIKGLDSIQIADECIHKKKKNKPADMCYHHVTIRYHKSVCTCSIGTLDALHVCLLLVNNNVSIPPHFAKYQTEARQIVVEHRRKVELTE